MKIRDGTKTSMVTKRQMLRLHGLHENTPQPRICKSTIARHFIKKET